MIGRYVLSLAALVAAIALRWVLDPWMGDALPLVTLYGAVLAAVWLAGWPTGVIVALLGYAACAYLFMRPRESLVGSFDISSALRSRVSYCALRSAASAMAS
jgi:K+-sensing histidine kinase KdpD